MSLCRKSRLGEVRLAGPNRRGPSRTESAFTLVEVVIAIAIVTLGFAGILSCYTISAQRAEWTGQSFAAQSLASQGAEQVRAAKWDPQAWPVVDELPPTNFSTVEQMDIPRSGRPVYATNYIAITDIARSAVNRVSDEIRAAKMVEIGNGNSASFSVIADNLPQIGNALQVYASTNTNSFVRYFMDPKESALKSMPSGSSAATVVASFVTNALVFRAEDFLGNVLTNNQDNRVIKMTLEFYQLQYPIVRIGPGY